MKVRSLNPHSPPAGGPSLVRPAAASTTAHGFGYRLGRGRAPAERYRPSPGLDGDHDAPFRRRGDPGVCPAGAAAVSRDRRAPQSASRPAVDGRPKRRALPSLRYRAAAPGDSVFSDHARPHEGPDGDGASGSRTGWPPRASGRSRSIREGRRTSGGCRGRSGTSRALRRGLARLGVRGLGARPASTSWTRSREPWSAASSCRAGPGCSGIFRPAPSSCRSGPPLPEGCRRARGLSKRPAVR